MKKIFILLTSMFLLVAVLKPWLYLARSSAIGGGNVVQSSVSSAVSYGVKKTTGKAPMQHALAYAEKKILIKRKNDVYLLLRKQIQKLVYCKKTNFFSKN